jgi:hypothetical protein
MVQASAAGPQEPYQPSLCPLNCKRSLDRTYRGVVLGRSSDVAESRAS